jgi:hypothetical protein
MQKLTANAKVVKYSLKLGAKQQHPFLPLLFIRPSVLKVLDNETKKENKWFKDQKENTTDIIIVHIENPVHYQFYH